jgi:hypothetical protein
MALYLNYLNLIGVEVTVGACVWQGHDIHRMSQKSARQGHDIHRMTQKSARQGHDIHCMTQKSARQDLD